MSVDPTTACHVDGEKLIRWLVEDVRRIDMADLQPLGDRWARLVRACSNEGRTPHIYTVDEFLCAIGVCLGEMPDECWTESPRPTPVPPPTRIDSSTRERILNLWALGWRKVEIAAMVGVNRETVGRHVRQAQESGA